MKRYQWKFVLFISVVCLLIVLLHPARHAKYYPYVPNEKILTKLVENAHVKHNLKLGACNYNQSENEEIFEYRHLFLANYDHVQLGGEYLPNDCTPKYSSAVILCYRQRPQQLDIFLKYMHSFLRRQNVHYRIFVAEQNNTKAFNRALMFDYGAVVAMTFGFPCLILHDVDLLPLNTGNMYACSTQPRHMSCSIDRMRFNLPYHEIVGGVLAINAEQFRMLNGMSTTYFGWGGEDDDFYSRMASKDLHPIRFSPEISKYTMLYHKREVPSPHRYTLLDKSTNRQSYDGLNSLMDNYEFIERDLYGMQNFRRKIDHLHANVSSAMK